eukprot:COSAG01_NODE_12931_length_1661_cov_2.455186_3_plen_52_part_00
MYSLSSSASDEEPSREVVDEPGREVVDEPSREVDELRAAASRSRLSRRCLS